MTMIIFLEDIPSPPEELVTADIAENDLVEVEQQFSAEVAETVEAVADTETSAAATEEIEQTSEEITETPAEVVESLQVIDSELENEVEVAQAAEVEVEAATDVHAEVTEEITENNVTEITENGKVCFGFYIYKLCSLKHSPAQQRTPGVRVVSGLQPV